MRLAFLKELFDSGVLASAAVEPADGAGWLLKVTKQSGEVVAVTLAAQSSQVKTYNRVNAAMMDAYRIGFRTVAVSLPEDFELAGAR